MSKNQKKAAKKGKPSTSGKADKSNASRPTATTHGKGNKDKSSSSRPTGAKTGPNGHQENKSANAKKITSVVPRVTNKKQTKVAEKEVANENSEDSFEVTLTESKMIDQNMGSRGSYTGIGTEPAVSNAQAYRLNSSVFQNPFMYPDVGDQNAQEWSAIHVTQESTSQLHMSRVPSSTMKPRTTTDQEKQPQPNVAATQPISKPCSASQGAKAHSAPACLRTARNSSISSKQLDSLSQTFYGQSSGPCTAAESTAPLTSKDSEPVAFGSMQFFYSETSVVATPDNNDQSCQMKQIDENKSSTSRSTSLAQSKAITKTTAKTYPPTGTSTNYLRSLSTPADTGKRHLISCRSTTGSIVPIGVLYGSIEGYLDCSSTAQVQTSLAMLKQGDSGGLALDICQVDASDHIKLEKINLLEAKSNLITIAPLVEGRVLLFDETSRGIELANTGHIKLDGDCISLAIATIGQTPRCLLKGAGTLERNRFERSRPHKVEVVSGLAAFLLGNMTPEASHRNTAVGIAATRIDLVMIVQNSAETTIALDDSLFWNPRTHPFTVLNDCATSSKLQPEASRENKRRLAPMRIDCGLEEDQFVFTEVAEHSVEYLLLLAERTSKTPSPLGILVGNVEGIINSPSVTLKGLAGPSLMLTLVLMDFHNRGLMALRRRVLSAEHLLTVTVGGSAVGNLCGDLGGGFLLTAHTQLTIACSRLLRLTSSQKNDDLSGPAKLDSCRAQDVTAQSKGRFAQYLGEITFLVTDGAKSLAYYIH